LRSFLCEISSAGRQSVSSAVVISHRNGVVFQRRRFALPFVSELKYMFLVGGFAESPMLQREIRQAFGAKLKVLIPQDVALTVLKGYTVYYSAPDRGAEYCDSVYVCVCLSVRGHSF